MRWTVKVEVGLQGKSPCVSCRLNVEKATFVRTIKSLDLQWAIISCCNTEYGGCFCIDFVNLCSRGHVSDLTSVQWETAPLKTYLFTKAKLLFFLLMKSQKLTHTCPDVRGAEDREQGLTWQPNTGQIQIVTTPSQQLVQSVCYLTLLQFTLAKQSCHTQSTWQSLSLSLQSIYTFLTKRTILYKWLMREDTCICVYDRKISRVRAERLCLFPCVSPRPFPHDFTTKAWSAPDGDPPVQCLSQFQSHLCQQHQHTQAPQTLQPQGAARKSGPPITALYYSPHFPDTT